MDPDRDSGAHRAADAGFRRWVSLLASAFERAGLQPARAEARAVMCIAAIEGALILVRAEGSMRPLELVHEQLRAVLAAEQAAALTR